MVRWWHVRYGEVAAICVFHVPPSFQANINAFVEAARRGKLTVRAITVTQPKYGIPISSTESEGLCHSALSAAIHAHQEQTVDLLLAAGADANVLTLGGCSPVWFAAVTSTSSILHRVIAAGGCVNQT